MSVNVNFFMVLPEPDRVCYDRASDEYTASSDSMRVAAVGKTEAEARQRFGVAALARLLPEARAWARVA